jgi:hypothetical protein
MVKNQPIFPKKGVSVEEINAQAVAALAAQDQRLADARSCAQALATFWENLPKKMPDDLRGVLTVRWQESQSQWLMLRDFDDDEDEELFE